MGKEENEGKEAQPGGELQVNPTPPCLSPGGGVCSPKLRSSPQIYRPLGQGGWEFMPTTGASYRHPRLDRRPRTSREKKRRETRKSSEGAVGPRCGGRSAGARRMGAQGPGERSGGSRSIARTHGPTPPGARPEPGVRGTSPSRILNQGAHC